MEPLQTELSASRIWAKSRPLLGLRSERLWVEFLSLSVPNFLEPLGVPHDRERSWLSPM